LALYQASRALAWLRGSDHVVPDHVQDVFFEALRHRVGLTYEAEAEKLTSEHILRKILDTETVPALSGTARAA
jgi:MoxR-like ATPase